MLQCPTLKMSTKPKQRLSGKNGSTTLHDQTEPYEFRTSTYNNSDDKVSHEEWVNNVMFCLHYTNIVAVQCSHATTMLNTSATLRHKLKCLIEGEDTVFSVIAASNDEVSDLKKSIRSERALDSLKDVGPHTLELWKVSAIFFFWITMRFESIVSFTCLSIHLGKVCRYGRTYKYQ